MEAVCVNTKVATEWNSGATLGSNPGPRARIPSALTTRPLSEELLKCRRTHGGSGVVGDDVEDDGVGLVAGVRRPSGLHLPQSDAERVDVCLGVGRLAAEQLRRTVRECPGQQRRALGRTHPTSVTFQYLQPPVHIYRTTASSCTFKAGEKLGAYGQQVPQGLRVDHCEGVSIPRQP